MKTLAELLLEYKIIATEKLVCPRCEAKPRNACTTLSGKKTSPHVPRVEPLLEAYLAGGEDIMNHIEKMGVSIS